jgi:hypothetical protein
MEELIRGYGIWILLAGVFVAMHWFGRGYGGGHRRASGGGAQADAAGAAAGKKVAAGGSGVGHRRSGCH